MPELKRNFDKGKMNKDLDERLLPPGEYKDAVNIEVTTSDGSNMGVVENIKGNTKISNISFREPFYDGQPLQSAHPSTNLPDFYGVTRPNAPITSFSSNAEVVGSVVDDKTKKLYGFVARALDFNTGVQGSGSVSVQTGVRSDAVFEFDTNKDDDGNYPLNEYVFVDAYQSRWNWGIIKAGKTVVNNAPDASIVSEAVNADGHSQVQITGSAYFNQTNGIEVDMVVKAVKPDGTNIWEDLGTIQVVSAGPVGGLVGVTNHVRLTLTGGVITEANINDGVVLEFTRKDRFLNFNPSTKYDYTDTEGDTRSSATPEDNKITGVNLFDGLLYFTDGTTEPKKINIERSKRGTLNSLFETTKLVYNRFDGQTIKEDLKISDITVMKRAPLNAPTLVMRNTGLEGEVSKIGIAPIDLSIIDNGGENNTVDLSITTNVEGNLVLPNTLQVGDNVDRFGIDVGDVIMLQNSGYEARLKVTKYLGGTGMTCEVLECNVAYLESCDVPLISWEARLESSTLAEQHPQKAMFEDEFTRIAYRWRYIDGEVSAISPFSKLAFITKGTYSYSSKEGYNNAMVNDLRELTVEGFLPYPYCSGEVIQVDILAKQEGVNNIKLLKSVKLKDFDETDGYAFAKPLSVGALDQKRGSIVFSGATFGSTLPSNQLLRPFDAVPRSAVAQTVSASRVIYGNYKEGYDLTDANGDNVDIKFHYSWDNDRKAVSFNDWSAYKATRHVGQFYGYESMKNGRTYSFGMVYRDILGRESSVMLGEHSTHTCPYSMRDKPVKVQINVDHNPPTWAKSFKFFVKESSDEYYNINLFAHFPATVDASQNAGDVWLVFNSVDRNKVEEGDILIIKKAHARQDNLGSSQASISNTMNKEYKILDISNEVPSDSMNEAVANTITGELKAGKFFVKVKLDRPLINAFGVNPGNGPNWRNYYEASGSGANNHNPCVFEVKPKENQDLDIYYEIPKSYPVSLDQENTSSWIDVGDKVYIYYRDPNFPEEPNKKVLGGANGNEFFIQDDIDRKQRIHYVNLKRSVARLLPPKHEGGHAIIRLDQAVTLGEISSDNNGELQQLPGVIHVVKSDGSFLTATIKYDDSYSGSSTDIRINTNKESIHKGPYRLPFANCFNFTNGVESNRIRDDFNAPTIKNGVKVSVTSSNYKEQQREHGLIFSGIYNSKNGVNNLNEFISSSGIKKDLNPQFGSIQILNARDTNITTICEHKTVKILANKDALFTAGGGGQVTSTKNVLGQTVPYAGEFGIGNMRGSFASEEFRSYFIDPYRSKVMRLSNDGLTPISDAGMSDYFSDSLSSVVASHGQYNRDKGEYDLTLHYNLNKTRGTKEVETISFSEGVRGWTSKKSYIPENSISLDNTYFTFKDGDTYVHEEAATINNFYGIQHNSSITTIMNDAPDLIKSFQTVGYEGSQAKIIQYKRSLDNEYNTAGGDQTYLDSAYAHSYNASPEGLVSGSNYYNNIARKGWFLESLTTDKQSGRVHEFLEKEGKWFNYIQGEETTFDNATNVGNIDTQELSVQGIGLAGAVNTNGVVFGNSSITTTVAVTGDGAANATVTGEVTSGIQNGTNTNTINTNNITITAAACFSFQSNYVSVGTLPTGVASVTIPSGQVILPGGSLVLTVVFSSATLSSNASFEIPVVIAAMNDVCQDHEFDIRITNPADNTNYSFDGVLALNDYVVYNPFLEVDTDYRVSGQSLLESITGISAQQTYSITFTADSGYYIPSTTSFDPTLAINSDPSDWSNVKVYVYDDNGNIISVAYTWSYEGQANNPDPTDDGVSAFDLFTYPSVSMISLTEETEVEEPPALDDYVTITVVLQESDGSQIANATTDSIFVEVISGTNLNTLNGNYLAIVPDDGFDAGEAANYALSPLPFGIGEVTLTNGESVAGYGIDNTIHVLPNFDSLIIEENTTIAISFATTRVVALVTGHKWLLSIHNQESLDSSVAPALTMSNGYANNQTVDAGNASGLLDQHTIEKSTAPSNNLTEIVSIVLIAKDDHHFSEFLNAGILNVFNNNDWTITRATSTHAGDANRKLTITIKYEASSEYNNTYEPLDTIHITKFVISSN